MQDGLIELVLERRGLDAILGAAADAAGADVRLEAPDRPPARHRAGRWQGRPGRAVRVPVGPDRPPEATLVAEADRRLGDWERIVLRHAAAVIALELQRDRALRASERRLLRDLVDEVVAGQPDERALRRRLSASGLDVGEGAAMAFVQAPETALLDAAMPWSARDGGLAVLLPAADDAAAEAAAARVADGLGGVPAGVGRVRRTAR